jgi:hypothetical protein
MKNLFFVLIALGILFLTSCNNGNNSQQVNLRLKNLATGTIASIAIDSSSSVFYNSDTIVLESGFSSGGYAIPKDLEGVVFDNTLVGSKRFVTRKPVMYDINHHTFTKFLLLEGGKKIPSVSL